MVRFKEKELNSLKGGLKNLKDMTRLLAQIEWRDT